MTTSGSIRPADSLPWPSVLVLWALFFMVCGSLGYGTLNRYDPRATRSLSDTQDYAALVESGPGPEADSHRDFRVLVPWMARPVRRLADGRVGTWDPVFLGLLAANAALVATAATALAVLAVGLGLAPPVGMLAGMLLAVNHVVVNAHLAGMVDAGELCAAVLLAAALLHGRWWALVPIGVGGALAKETFVVLGGVMAAAWWWMEWRRSPRALRSALWIGAMAAAGLGAVLLVRLLATGSPATPMAIAGSLHGDAAVAARMANVLLDADFWYGLVWLLPLGLWSLGRIPRPWAVSAFAAAGAALVMGAYALAGGGNTARPVISLAGPPLSLAAAVTLARQPWLRRPPS